MKLKLIDEEWIDKLINIYQENLNIPTPEIRMIYECKIETLKLVKRELQSPKEPEPMVDYFGNSALDT